MASRPSRETIMVVVSAVLALGVLALLFHRRPEARAAPYLRVGVASREALHADDALSVVGPSTFAGPVCVADTVDATEVVAQRVAVLNPDSDEPALVVRDAEGRARAQLDADGTLRVERLFLRGPDGALRQLQLTAAGALTAKPVAEDGPRLP